MKTLFDPDNPLGGNAVVGAQLVARWFLIARQVGLLRVPGQKFFVLTGGLALTLTTGIAMASIANTKHNLGSSANASYVAGTSNRFGGTTDICVFCHTPHGANAAAPVPLWNRNFSTSAYITYESLGTTSFDAAGAPTGSVSLACLSCHDGTQGMDIMINTPGSGTNPAAFSASGTWTISDKFSTGGLAGKFAYIGVDLTNDHPVSIQYGGGGVSDTNALLPGTIALPLTIDPYFAQPSGNSIPMARSVAGIGQVGTRVLGSGKRVWWVEVDGITGQSKTDLTLYSRTDGSGSSVNQPFVECASCHDPHSNNTLFLRHTSANESSATCLTCHIK